jgi:hypothetical protein
VRAKTVKPVEARVDHGCRVWIPTCFRTCSLAQGCETLAAKTREAQLQLPAVHAQASRGEHGVEER